MQFLFVVLMSVLVGASALPHVLQAPNRPSFSLRKNTSFSLVAIPKFFQKVASLDKTLAAIEEEQIRKKQAALARAQQDLTDKKTVDERAEREAAVPEVARPERTPTAVLDPLAAPTTAPTAALEIVGHMYVETIDVRACVCTDQGQMTCQVWVDGSCTHQDKFVEVSAAAEGRESTKNFRCKEQNRFGGNIAVHGGGVGTLTFNYLTKKQALPINLINHCGQIGTVTPQDDE